MSKASANEGAKGWLMVLIVVVGLLMPLGQLGSFIKLWNAAPVLESRFGDNWSVYFGLASTVGAVRAAICLYVADLLLNKKRPSTPRRAIIGIWVALILLAMVSMAITASMISGPVSYSGAMVSLFWSLLICVIATAYLLRSKRVASIYGTS